MAAAPRGHGRGRGRRAAPLPLFPDEMLCDLSSVKVERGPAPVKAERAGSQDAPAGAVLLSGGALPQAAPPAPWWEIKAEQRGAAPAPGAPAVGQGPASAAASQPWWEPSQAGRPAGAPGAPQAAGAAAAPAQAPLGGAGLSVGDAGGSLGLAGAPPAAACSAIPSMLDIALLGEDWRALAAAAPGRPAPWGGTHRGCFTGTRHRFARCMPCRAGTERCLLPHALRACWRGLPSLHEHSRKVAQQLHSPLPCWEVMRRVRKAL